MARARSYDDHGVPESKGGRKGVRGGGGREDRQKRLPGAAGIRESTNTEALFSPGSHKAVITRKL